jgi:hypothetical protein
MNRKFKSCGDYSKEEIGKVDKLIKEVINKKAKKNRKFKVWAKYDNYCYTIVEASTKKEAQEKAEYIDGGDFIPDDRKTWMSAEGMVIIPEMTEEVK